MSVPKKRRHRHFPRRMRLPFQRKACLLRRAIRFPRVDVPRCENAIFPTRIAATGPGKDVIDIPFSGLQSTPRILASTAITFPKSPRSEFRTLHGNLREIHTDNNRRDTDQSMRRSDAGVVVPNRQLLPVLPRGRTHVVFPVNIESRRGVGCHLAKRFGGRSRIDRLPVPIQYENGFLMQDRSAHDEFA